MCIFIYCENYFFSQKIVRWIPKMGFYTTNFCAKLHSFVYFVIPPLKLKFIMEIVTPLSIALGTELQ